MATVYIPSLMRDLTGGRDRADVQGRTVIQVIDALDATYPGVKARVCADVHSGNGNRLAPGVAVSVDGVIVRLGLRAPVKADSTIRFLPVIEGG
ncbi:MAG: MoaD/ThiS family protein [Anaerolineae bacterium]|nr:MoaD/ThiS family protein [Anaerolineae bacterium]